MVPRATQGWWEPEQEPRWGSGLLSIHTHASLSSLAHPHPQPAGGTMCWGPGLWGPVPDLPTKVFSWRWAPPWWCSVPCCSTWSCSSDGSWAPTVGTSVLGREVLYPPDFFTYAEDTASGWEDRLFQGLSLLLRHLPASPLTWAAWRFFLQMRWRSCPTRMTRGLLWRGERRRPPRWCWYRPCPVCCPAPRVSCQQLLGPFHGVRGKAQQRVELHWQYFQRGLLRFSVSLVLHLLGDAVFLRGYNLLAPPSVPLRIHHPWWMIAPWTDQREPTQICDGDASEHADFSLPAGGWISWLWTIVGHRQGLPSHSQGSSLDPRLEGPEGVGPAFLQHPLPPHLSTTKCHQNPALPRTTWTTWKNTAAPKQ